MVFTAVSGSNYTLWLIDPANVLPSSHVAQSTFGQEIVNADLGSFSSGIHITTGLFNAWKSFGITQTAQLKALTTISSSLAVLCISASYSVLHITALSNVSFRNTLILAALASISWSGHLVHTSIPTSLLIESGIDPSLIPEPTILLCLPKVSIGTGFLSLSSAHHLFLGLALILIAQRPSRPVSNPISVHSQLAIVLLISSAVSLTISVFAFFGLTHPFLSTDYPAVISLFTYHLLIAGSLLIGFGAHLTISMLVGTRSGQFLAHIIVHRDIILGHLIWATLFLGVHFFGIYIHNDTTISLGRFQDTFSDNSISLKPVFATATSNSNALSVGNTATFSRFNLGTADFLVCHIHSFTAHTTLLVLLKGSLLSRSSRLVPDKMKLGFRYPCDGPGRGGTCQISPWDHTFLSTFWMYNCLSAAIFNVFWKVQSDAWGKLASDSVSHLSPGDFSANSVYINGWLRNFLWTGSGQVIQSYGSSLSLFGLLFIGSHFVWALSLMFLFSGRGYWQELIESVLWAHQKLKFQLTISLRALSITQGRCVGAVHYLLGGIAVTGSFIVGRSSALVM